MKLTAILFLLMAVQLNAQLKPVAYADGSQKLNGFAAQPGKPLKGKPGIVVLPAWKGINNHAKEVAQKLSDAGYHAFVADIYGEGNYPANPSEAGKQSGYYKSHPNDYQRRISLAIEQLAKSGANRENIVVIGTVLAERVRSRLLVASCLLRP